jgi:hypothetical protein
MDREGEPPDVDEASAKVGRACVQRGRRSGMNPVRDDSGDWIRPGKDYASSRVSSRHFPTFSLRVILPSGAPLKWKYEPKPLAAAQGVACCDVVDRGNDLIRMIGKKRPTRLRRRSSVPTP